MSHDSPMLTSVAAITRASATQLSERAVDFAWIDPGENESEAEFIMRRLAFRQPARPETITPESPLARANSRKMNRDLWLPRKVCLEGIPSISGSGRGLHSNRSAPLNQTKFAGA